MQLVVLVSRPYKLEKYVVLWLLLLQGNALKFEIFLICEAVAVPGQVNIFTRQEKPKVSNRKRDCYEIMYVIVFAPTSSFKKL